MILTTSHLTSPGSRSSNEDALIVAQGEGFSVLALADGLGGHGGAGPAARCCVEAAAAAFARAPTLSDDGLQAVVDEAARAVATLRREKSEPPDSMRTTFAMLGVTEWKARWVHVGDSRVYWFRDGFLMSRTRDHNVAELVSGVADESLTAPSHKADRHRLLRAIGGAETCRADLSDTVVALQPGDTFLLCSDGLWSLIPDEKITATLGTVASPDEWCRELRARLVGALGRLLVKQHDDYSLIAGFVLP